jgi:hypothetical protein
MMVMMMMIMIMIIMMMMMVISTLKKNERGVSQNLFSIRFHIKQPKKYQ